MGIERHALRGVELWSGDLMTQVLAATSTLFRDRDLFVHDGSKLRRFRVSAPVQALFFAIILSLVAWASFATAQLLSRPHDGASLSAATEARARQIEQRQALIEAALSGQKMDPALIEAASAGGRRGQGGPPPPGGGQAPAETGPRAHGAALRPPVAPPGGER